MKKKIFAATVTVHSLSTVCCRSCLFFLYIFDTFLNKNITEENFKKFETFYNVYYTNLKNDNYCFLYFYEFEHKKICIASTCLPGL